MIRMVFLDLQGPPQPSNVAMDDAKNYLKRHLNTDLDISYHDNGTSFEG